MELVMIGRRLCAGLCSSPVVFQPLYNTVALSAGRFDPEPERVQVDRIDCRIFNPPLKTETPKTSNLGSNRSEGKG